ncbi:MAG: hypothetical protein HPY65_13295 [Syntrophaceae bacterium]|nr:hypothetical protein [Syntrophaceae bacterium]
MRKQASRHIREEIDTLEGLLSRTEGQTETISGLIDALDEWQMDLPSGSEAPFR